MVGLESRPRSCTTIREKYGIHWKLSLWGSLLTGRIKHRIVLEIDIPLDAGPA